MYIRFLIRALLTVLTYTCVYGQDVPVAVSVGVTEKGNAKFFQANLPALKAIPGGRAPFYTYLWDFGDGHFSTEATPEHVYDKPGDYTVQFYAVNNYDDGIRPPRPVKKNIQVSKSGSAGTVSQAESSFFASNGVFQLSKNANALPGEDMVITAGLKAQGKGRVFILTNEKVFAKDGLIYRGQSQYNGEKLIPQDSLNELKNAWAAVSEITITQSGSPDYGNRVDKKVNAKEAVRYFSKLYGSYKTVSAYEVTGNNTGQFSFINLDVAPDMMKDTNAIVTITGVFLPDNGPAVVHQLEVPIVASHDPNKMSLKRALMSYRRVSYGKKMLYKVQFQNDGEGDAKNIRLEVNIRDNVNLKSFELQNLSPKCPPCIDSTSRGCWRNYMKDDETLVFHFKDISLPGTRAKDIKDSDSTKGFIRFTVKSKNLKNKKFKGQTKIFFDKNEPITTNYATGRFLKSLSPFVYAGYHSVLQSQKPEGGVNAVTTKSGWMAGIGIAPLAPYRKIYWQVEVYTNSQETSSQSNVREPGVIIVDNGKRYNYERYDKTVIAKYMQFHIVPVQLRYNLTNFLAVGAGVKAKFDISVSETEERVYYPLINGQEESYSPGAEKNKGSSGNFRVQPFLDLGLGLVTLGPSMGLRYTYDGRQGQFLDIYAAWKF